MKQSETKERGYFYPFSRTVEIITAETPRYFMEREKALIHHNFHGGFLWKRKPDVSKFYKPYAAGVLPASRLYIYELWQVNGRPPTESDILELARYSSKD